MSGALYFPYISTPDDAWFTRVLLYWDTVGTIVPGGLEEDPKFISPQMAALREENLLQLVSPAFDLATVPNFRDAFAEYLEADEIVRSRRDNAELMRFTKVHVFKLGDVAEYLIDQKLARCRDGPGWELWLEVEQRTAALFMAYLAATLGALQDGMDPVTDQAAAMAALLGLDTSVGVTLKRARELRLGILDELLPGPAAPVDAAALRRFKDDHRDELSAFRDLVDGELLKAAILDDADAREKQAEISTRQLVRERDNLVALMQRRRWPEIVFGSIAGVAAAAAGVAGGLVLGPVAGAAFAVPGVIPAVFAAVKDVRTKPDFGDRPVAFAALARQHFGT